MANTTATRRSSRRASVADVEDAAARRSSSKLRFFVILASLGIAGGAIAAAYWQPPMLTSALAPLWTQFGPALIIVPLIVLGSYVGFRIFGLRNLRVWRWAIATVLTYIATLVALQLFGVTEVRGVTVESEITQPLSGLSPLMLGGLLAGLTLTALILNSPLGAIRAGRAAGAAGAGAAAAAGRGIQNVRSTPDATDTDEEDMPDLGEQPVPQNRIVVPEPARSTTRPTYPEPVGVARDQQRRVQKEREAARQEQGDSAKSQEQGGPRIVVPETSANDDAARALQSLGERHAAETEAKVEEKRDLPLPPPGLSSNPEPLHSDTAGEGFGLDPSELDETAQRDPLAVIDEDDEEERKFWEPETEADLPTEDSIPEESLEEEPADEPDEAIDAIEDAGEWDSDTITLAADEDEEPAEEDDEAADELEEAVIDDADEDPAQSRSDQELLDSLDPFTGLPKVAWKFPSFKLFDDQPPAEIDTESHMETAEAIQETLQEYGIEVEVTEVRPGPTVTLYGVRPGWDRRYRTVRERNEEGEIVARRQEVGRTRVKVDAISKLDDDLALQLKAASVRIETIPSTNLVGVEVPNMTPETVFMRPQLESDAYRKARGKSKLAFPLGKGSGGEPVVADLARMPHLLVAGSTGSGKSVFVNSLITSLITRATPEELRFVMIDPKRVELTIYNGIPHLITPVIVDTQKVVNALQWMVQQMEDRLEQLAQQGARDISSYNEKVGEGERMPYLVLIVDELADLMMTSGKAVENGLVRLAQMGRATGIHLVVATQRPSVNVITGLIKANFPTRISFMVTSLVDSRTILDGAGAEKLLGRGDMLYLPQDASRPIRIQSAFISSHESDAVVDAWRAQSRGYVPPELPELVQPEDIGLQSRGRNGTDGAAEPSGAKRNGSGGEDIMEQARELADIYNGKVSTSLLQRRLGIGYPRAARLRDRLVEEGLAGAEIPNAPAETAGRGARRTREAAEAAAVAETAPPREPAEITED